MKKEDDVIQAKNGKTTLQTLRLRRFHAGCAFRMKGLRIRKYKCTIEAGHALQKIIEATSEAKHTSDSLEWSHEIMVVIKFYNLIYLNKSWIKEIANIKPILYFQSSMYSTLPACCHKTKSFHSNKQVRNCNLSLFMQHY